LTSIATLRSDVMVLCRDAAYQKAFMKLIEYGLGPTEAPSVWRYLYRQTRDAGVDALAREIMTRMTSNGLFPPEFALEEANKAIFSGDGGRASQLIEAVAGANPTNPSVKLQLFRATERDDPDRALALIKPIAMKNEENALIFVDFLRRNDRFQDALGVCQKSLTKFGKTPRLSGRYGRVLEGLQDWEGALHVYTKLAASSPFDDPDLWLRIIWLGNRLQRWDERNKGILRFLGARPAVTSYVELSEIIGDMGLLEVAIENHCARQPQESNQDADLVAALLNSGYVGLARYVVRERGAAGRVLTDLLDQARVENNWPALSARIAAATAQQSPACLLPFPPETKMVRPDYTFDRNRDTVLIVNASMTAGGAERQLIAMVSALLRQGLPQSQIHVALYSLVGDRGQKHFLPDLEAQGVTVHDLRAEIAQRMSEDQMDTRTALLPAAMRRDVAMLTPLVKRLRPKVIHAWQDRPSLSAGWVAALEMVPRLVLSKRNMTPPKRVGAPVKVDQTTLRMLAKLPNTVLSVNSADGARDYEDWLDLPHGAAKVLANGLEVPARLEKRIASPDTIRVHGVFRFSPAKRPLLWLDTVARLQELSAVPITPILYGNGPLEQEITEHAASIGIKNLRIVIGEKNRQVIYGGADLVLLMSQIEGTPNVLLEAQAEGIAVAGCNVGGTKDAMFDPGEGPYAGSLLFDPDVTPYEAAQMLAAWLPNALKAPRADRHAFIKVNFSIATLGETLLDLYSQPSKDRR